MNSGYIIVDCTGLDLSKTTQQTISGIYEKTKKALESGKPIICANANWNNMAVSPFYCFGWNDSNTFIMNACILQVQIKNNDKVTVAVNPAIPS